MSAVLTHPETQTTTTRPGRAGPGRTAAQGVARDPRGRSGDELRGPAGGRSAGTLDRRRAMTQ